MIISWDDYKPNPREVEKIEFFSRKDIQKMINKEKFHPELLFLLRKHFGFNNKEHKTKL